MPMDRRTAARIAALSRWGRMNEAERREATKPGRDAFLDRFEREPNPRAALRAQMLRTRAKRAAKYAPGTHSEGAMEVGEDGTEPHR